MRPFMFLVVCFWALSLATARRAPKNRRKTLVAGITTDDICQKPREVAITLAQALVNGNGLSNADAEAISGAGNKCCSQLTAALASASSFARSGGTGDKFSSAASQAAAAAGFTGCAQQSFAAVTASSSAGAGGGQATVSTQARGTGNAGPSGTTSRASFRIGSGGQYIAQSTASVKP